MQRKQKRHHTQSGRIRVRVGYAKTSIAEVKKAKVFGADLTTLRQVADDMVRLQKIGGCLMFAIEERRHPEREERGAFHYFLKLNDLPLPKKL
jgi:hypothetical protein